MRVTYRYQGKQAECRSCHEVIETGSKAAWHYVMVGGKRKLHGFHLDCWVKDLYQSYDSAPFLPKPRGRKPQTIEPGHRQHRARLSSRYHGLRHKRDDLERDGKTERLFVLERLSPNPPKDTEGHRWTA